MSIIDDYENELDKNCVGLGSPTPVFLAITITHPLRRKKWSNMTSDEQCSYLSKVFATARHVIKSDKPKQYGETFEKHENGNMHLHGFIKYYPNKRVNFDYAKDMCDFAKIVCRTLKVDFMLFHYYQQFQRYKMPCVCIQLESTQQGQDRWHNYMYKQQ